MSRSGPLQQPRSPVAATAGSGGGSGGGGSPGGKRTVAGLVTGKRAPYAPAGSVCENCRVSRCKCEGGYPCNRCFRLNKPCRPPNSPPKKRGRKPKNASPPRPATNTNTNRHPGIVPTAHPHPAASSSSSSSSPSLAARLGIGGMLMHQVQVHQMHVAAAALGGSDDHTTAETATAASTATLSERGDYESLVKLEEELEYDGEQQHPQQEMEGGGHGAGGRQQRQQRRQAKAASSMPSSSSWAGGGPLLGLAMDRCAPGAFVEAYMQAFAQIYNEGIVDRTKVLVLLRAWRNFGLAINADPTFGVAGQLMRALGIPDAEVNPAALLPGGCQRFQTDLGAAAMESERLKGTTLFRAADDGRRGVALHVWREDGYAVATNEVHARTWRTDAELFQECLSRRCLPEFVVSSVVDPEDRLVYYRGLLEVMVGAGHRRVCNFLKMFNRDGDIHVYILEGRSAADPATGHHGVTWVHEPLPPSRHVTTRTDLRSAPPSRAPSAASSVVANTTATSNGGNGGGSSSRGSSPRGGRGGGGGGANGRESQAAKMMLSLPVDRPLAPLKVEGAVLPTARAAAGNGRPFSMQAIPGFALLPDTMVDIATSSSASASFAGLRHALRRGCSRSVLDPQGQGLARAFEAAPAQRLKAIFGQFLPGSGSSEQQQMEKEEEEKGKEQEQPAAAAGGSRGGSIWDDEEEDDVYSSSYASCSEDASSPYSSSVPSSPMLAGASAVQWPEQEQEERKQQEREQQQHQEGESQPPQQQQQQQQQPRPQRTVWHQQQQQQLQQRRPATAAAAQGGSGPDLPHHAQHAIAAMAAGGHGSGSRGHHQHQQQEGGGGYHHSTVLSPLLLPFMPFSFSSASSGGEAAPIMDADLQAVFDSSDDEDKD